MGPLVSVLMPALNEEKFLEEAVDSVLKQAGVQVEVLIVDGCSVDGTAAIAQRMAAQDPRVRVFENPRVAIASGLNVALEHARGEYVARCDCHARISPTYLARGTAALEADPALVGIGGIRIGLGKTSSGRAIALALSSRFGVGDSINHYATEFCLTDHASFGVYRTSAARSVNGWDESFRAAEDVDFDHRLLAQGWKLAFDPEMKIFWTVRSDVVSFWKQYRRYGRGKARMVRKQGLAGMRPRHFVAPSAVVFGTLLALSSAHNPRILWAFAPYVGALIAASTRAWSRRERQDKVAPLSLPAAFVAMHTGWGLGFLEGMISGKVPDFASGSGRTNVTKHVTRHHRSPWNQTLTAHSA